MGWAIGYDERWQRDVGYGVLAQCDHPGCKAKIHRGLAHVCGGEPFGGEHGCGLYFCGWHLGTTGGGVFVCAMCEDGLDPFKPTPDVPEWLEHKLTNPSWARWRAENPEEVASAHSVLASGIEARSDETQRGSAEGESPARRETP